MHGTDGQRVIHLGTTTLSMPLRHLGSILLQTYSISENIKCGEAYLRTLESLASTSVSDTAVEKCCIYAAKQLSS
eukprot:COSAG02_NODE_81_length_39811_cov_51.728898_30_plen_75_part_00